MLWDDWPAAINSIFEDSYRTAVRTGLPVSFDAYYPAPLDGWYELRAWPTPDGLSVYFPEVTERRRVQEQRRTVAPGGSPPRPGERRAAGPLDAQTATGRLPRMVVPALADFCIVTLVEHRGRPARRRVLARRPRHPGAARAVRRRAHGRPPGGVPGGPRPGQRRAVRAQGDGARPPPAREARRLLGRPRPATRRRPARCAAAAGSSAS